MANEHMTIDVDPTSELGRALAEADEAVVLVSGGVRYRVRREADDIFAGYDPERVRAALEASAGALAGVDTAKLKRELQAQREQDGQGHPG